MTFENLALKTIFRFTKSFLTRNIVSPPGKYPWQGLFKTPLPGTHFFSDPPFSKFDIEGYPPSRKGEADTVAKAGLACNLKTFFSPKSLLKALLFLNKKHFSAKIQMAKA